MRNHWSNCITNFDQDVDAFVGDYFNDPKRKVLLVAAAGFDPRSQRVSKMLADALGDRLTAYYIREERPGATDELVKRAEGNEAALKAIVPESKIFKIDVFADDGAPVGGARVVAEILANPIASDVTDVILDLSALSIGIGFPAAKLLLEECEADEARAFHLMIVSNPELDDLISSVPSSRISPVKGFAPDVGMSSLDAAQIWIPQLARGRASTLTQIGATPGNWYKICPVLPFPARNPRRADDLLTEYQNELVNEWEIDPRDIVYASEKNPLDCYRTLSTLKQRFDRTMDGTYEPRMVLSPLGSKVLAAGAMMAAIEHGMSVQYVETESYDFSATKSSIGGPPDMLVHLVLSGPLYAGYLSE
ncbi:MULTISPECIES: hypothetical protein [unclassified Novosphingobium]|uniref:hypothetical protein n=1 Tax=unclassified Novosphingobium TaxID=2644732 RepID=UPI0006B8AB7E|nr:MULTISPECIES: hypothetical protein [unclassified Novosphingobium]KPF88426.1 hypothetical protein IP81_18525 [Novosphingobium sp. AAP83]CAH0498044.1 hypothetical protein NVSP9465_03119 [Novosphingobium sp. CECT 9465]